MDDMISRQVAITAIQKAYADTVGGTDRCAVWKNVGLTNALHIMQDLPSAQPEKAYIATVMLMDEQVKEAVEEAKNAVLSVIKLEPHWTPCSEELPKENGYYLVTFHQTATEEDLGFDMDDTDVRKMRYDTKHGWRTPRRIPSWINDAVVSTVLAWMPLPEPYAERKEDE